MHTRVLFAALVGVALTACDDEVPVPAPPMMAVAIGEHHSCGLTDSGQAYCWGDASSGQLGTGGTASQLYAVAVAGQVRFTSIVAGGSHTCGLTSDGVALCWGLNTHGQVGSASAQRVLEPRPLETNLRFTQLSAGWAHTCGITSDGRAYCWGRGTHGELGNGVRTEAVFTPTAVASDIRFRMVSAGGRHSCAVAESGDVYCWGANEVAQLGTGAEGDAESVPVRADASFPFAEVSAGYNHTCAVTPVMTAWCWGENRHGEIGNNTSYEPGLPAERRPTPVTNFGTVAYVSVSAGQFYTCGRRDQNELMCWGRGANGQLGNTGTSDSNLPQLVHGEPGRKFSPGNGIFAAFDAGGSTHVCAVTIGGKALCWGQGAEGQLGSGEWLSMIPYPVLLRAW